MKVCWGRYFYRNVLGLIGRHWVDCVPKLERNVHNAMVDFIGCEAWEAAGGVRARCVPRGDVFPECTFFSSLDIFLSIAFSTYHFFFGRQQFQRITLGGNIKGVWCSY